MSEGLFSHIAYAFDDAQSTFEDNVVEAGFGEYTRIDWDSYDNSIEFREVRPDARMGDAAQRIVFAAGFSKAYVNHSDGWQTHYSWDQGQPFKTSRGWRRRYVTDANASTTNVITGSPNPGYYEISYWPEGWKHKDWLETGYMRIVPDPLEIKGPPASVPSVNSSSTTVPGQERPQGD